MIQIPERIAQVYRARQRERELRREQVWEQFLEQNPELGELERRRRYLNIRLIQFSLKDRTEGLEESDTTREIKEELLDLNERLEREQSRLLDGSEDSYCKLCHDSGEYEGELCGCAEDILRQLEQRAGVAFPPPRDQKFERFDPEIFPAEKNPEWYSGRLSPREVIVRWRDRLLAASDAFPEKQIHLYLFGTTGTGKSYLAAAVANRLRRKGYSSSFLSVNRYLQIRGRLRVLEASFNPDREELQRAREELKTVEQADCLVLDDLGTERLSDDQYNDLIELLNKRSRQSHSSIIITGNLAPQQFSEKYDERIGSRLIGQFVQARLEGPDLRFNLARRRREQLK